MAFKILQSRKARLALLALLCLAFWAYSVPSRTRDFGRTPVLTDGNWASLTMHSLSAARNWQAHGFLALRGLLVLEPLSIENETTPDALPSYSSYSAAYLAPVHLYQLAAGRPVKLAELQWLSLLAHLVFVVLISWLVCLLAGFAAGVLAAALATFHFRALAFFGICWWPDLAVLPALALFYMTLHLHLEAPGRRKISILLGTTVFAGTLLDWSFSLHLAAVCALLFWRDGFSPKNVLLLRGTWKWLLPPAVLALGLFFAQLFLWGNSGNFTHAFLLRTGQEQGTPEFVTLMKRILFGNERDELMHVERLQVALAALTALWLLARDIFSPGRKPGPLTITLVPVVLGVSLHVVLLREHYLDHFYEWTKLALPAAFTAAAIALFPYRRAGLLLGVGAVGVACWLNVAEHESFRGQFMGPEAEALAAFLSEKTAYEDLVFTPGARAMTQDNMEPTQEQMDWARAASSAHKHLWPAASPEDARLKANQMMTGERRARARLRFLVEKAEVPRWEAKLKKIPFTSSARGDRLYSLD